MEHRVKELNEAAYACHLTQVFFQPVNRDNSIFHSVVLTVTPITGGRLASGFIPGFRLCRLKVFYSKAQSGEDDEEDEETYEPIMARGEKIKRDTQEKELNRTVIAATLIYYPRSGITPIKSYHNPNISALRTHTPVCSNAEKTRDE